MCAGDMKWAGSISQPIESSQRVGGMDYEWQNFAYYYYLLLQKNMASWHEACLYSLSNQLRILSKIDKKKKRQCFYFFIKQSEITFTVISNFGHFVLLANIILQYGNI